MKIYIYISDLGAGGAERVCCNLANELTRLGHEIHIVALNLEQDVYSHTLDSKIKVHSLHASRIRYGILPMIRLLRKEKAENVLVFGSEMGGILTKVRSLGLLKCKIVVRILNNIEITISKEEKISPLVQKVLKKSQKNMKDMDFVIAQCKAMEEMLKKNVGLSENCKCIYNPVSQYLVEHTKPIEKKENEPKNIGFIGRIDPQKNIEDLLGAFALLCKEEKDVKLHIYGKGIHEEKARKIVEDKHLQDKVLFQGIRSDMENVYAGLDMVVLSSKYEGMPNALIEAIAIGIPVVSYDCPIGPSEIIVEDVNGYLIPMDNVEALAFGMKKCIHKNWNRDAIRKSADKFCVEQIAKEYEQVFHSLGR